MTKKAQQEIVGFVLIVTLVVVGLMVYLAISVRSSSSEEESLEVSNALDAIMKQTTKCAISAAPDYDDFEDLFESAYNDKRCANINEDAIEYLESALREVLDDIMASESSIDAYELRFSEKEDDGSIYLVESFPIITDGDCTGSVKAAYRTITMSSGKLLISLKTCVN